MNTEIFLKFVKDFMVMFLQIFFGQTMKKKIS